MNAYDEVSKDIFLDALQSSLEGLCDLAGASVGDKTLIDTLDPAITSYKQALQQGKSFKECLIELKIGAENGKENTKTLVAKIGRAARLGERSRGFLDAGATSCCIILCTMADVMIEELQ